jgi:hypothetical protein
VKASPLPHLSLPYLTLPYLFLTCCALRPDFGADLLRHEADVAADDVGAAPPQKHLADAMIRQTLNG